MSETFTLIVFLLMVTISFVAAAWAALTLALRKTSANDRALYVLFSLLLPAQLGVALLFRGSFYASYLSVALFGLSVLVAFVGSLLLFVLGIFFLLRFVIVGTLAFV